MPKRIGLTEVRALKPGELIWDGEVLGFGARRQKGTAVVYVLKYRTVGVRQRWFTIGKHGSPWTPDTARKEARKLLNRISEGADPAAEKHEARHALTMADLCTQYLVDAETGRLLVRAGRPKKPLTLASDRGRINGHIIPKLGKLAVVSLTRRDVEKFMHAVAEGETKRDPRKTRPRGVSRLRGGRGVATRAVSLLGAIFSYAVERGFRSDNPAHGIQKFAENKRERRLSDAEYATLGTALRQADGIWPPAVACLKFLALTGWRSGEAVSLRWSDIDLARRTGMLPDTKTGKSMRPLSHPACDLLRSMPRVGAGDLVFPGTRANCELVGFKKFVRRIVAAGGLPPDITPHVLRHSFVSLAADLGFSEPTIASLVGHKTHSVTSRYTHFADAPLLAAADAVARRTAELMGETEPVAEVVQLRMAV